MKTLAFQVKKKNPVETRLISTNEVPLAEGEIRLKVELFAFTANNLTYAAAGDMLGYWTFFPAAENADNSWGTIPVWSFAHVMETRNKDIAIGDRYYGYFPPATSVVMLPTNVSDEGFVDGVAHRQALPKLYNQYQKVPAAEIRNSDKDIARALLAPLHGTSFCLWEKLKDNSYYHAAQVVIVSASSKTSIGLAHGLHKDCNAPPVVGITSSGHANYVKSLSVYDSVITYDGLENTLPLNPTVVVDMAGNSAVRRRLHDELQSKLLYYVSVGLTHWEDLTEPNNDSGVTETRLGEQFFAPTYLANRGQSPTAQQFETEIVDFIASAVQATFPSIDVDKRAGLIELDEIYEQICHGKIPPHVGIVVEM
ncbi:MAG: DUF2855 family protein [Pseudomonadota bacterium]